MAAAADRWHVTKAAQTGMRVTARQETEARTGPIKKANVGISQGCCGWGISLMAVLQRGSTDCRRTSGLKPGPSRICQCASPSAKGPKRINAQEASAFNAGWGWPRLVLNPSGP